MKNNIIVNKLDKKTVSNPKETLINNRSTLIMNHKESYEVQTKKKTRNIYSSSEILVGAVKTVNKNSIKLVNISGVNKNNINNSVLCNRPLKTDSSIRLTKDSNHERNYSIMFISSSVEKNKIYMKNEKNSVFNKRAKSTTELNFKEKTKQIASITTGNSKKISENINSKYTNKMKTIPELNQSNKLIPIRIKPLNENKISVVEKTKLPNFKKLNLTQNTHTKREKNILIENASSKTLFKISKENNNIPAILKKAVNINKVTGENKSNITKDKLILKEKNFNISKDKLILKEKIKTQTLNSKNTISLNSNKTIETNKIPSSDTLNLVKPDINMPAPIKIQKNLKPAKSLQVLPAMINSIKDESNKTNNFQSSFNIYMKTTMANPISNKQYDNQTNKITRSFDQKLNSTNLNITKINESKKNIPDSKTQINKGQLNITDKSLKKNSLKNRIKIKSSKLNLFEIHDTISNCSLDSFSLIHEKSELNSGNNKDRSIYSDSNLKNENHYDFEIEPLDNQIDKVYENINTTGNQYHEEDVEEYENNNLIKDDDQECEQEEENTGALTLDQLKDIIIYFNFDEENVGDKSVFFLDDQKEFDENSKQKYKKYFFKNNLNKSGMEDAHNISPSTKDSSSFRQVCNPIDIK